MSWQINVDPVAPEQFTDALADAELEGFDPESEPTKVQAEVARQAAERIADGMEGEGISVHLRGLATGMEGTEEGNAPDTVHVAVTALGNAPAQVVWQASIEGSREEAVSLAEIPDDLVPPRAQSALAQVPKLAEPVDGPELSATVVAMSGTFKESKEGEVVEREGSVVRVDVAVVPEGAE